MRCRRTSPAPLLSNPAANRMDVHGFFSNWDVYRLCIEQNTLHHREAGSILREELLGRPIPFDFLDLACGDAQMTAKALSGTEVHSYTGVDFSAAALALAHENVAHLECPAIFHEADFAAWARDSQGTHDVIYLRLSLHHFDRTTKREIAKHLRRLVSPRGAVYIFEPVLREGESIAECLSAWHAHMDHAYAGFPHVAREALWEHVRTSDTPETPGEYMHAALAAGFREAAKLFTSPAGFYTLFRFLA